MHVCTEKSEVIYMSPQAKFGENDAIRGGIPICFPQFGPRGALPQHGFSRKSNDWVLGERAESEDGSKIEFVLKDTEATRRSAICCALGTCCPVLTYAMPGICYALVRGARCG
eukprot:1979325-Rhodomonas_salina.2